MTRKVFGNAWLSRWPCSLGECTGSCWRFVGKAASGVKNWMSVAMVSAAPISRGNVGGVPQMPILFVVVMSATKSCSSMATRVLPILASTRDLSMTGLLCVSVIHGGSHPTSGTEGQSPGALATRCPWPRPTRARTCRCDASGTSRM